MNFRLCSFFFLGLILQAVATVNTCPESDEEPQPIGIDFSSDMVIASYAYAADNITVLAAFKLSYDDPYPNLMFRLRAEDFQRGNHSKVFERAGSELGILHHIIAAPRQWVSSLANKSFLEHPAISWMKLSRALHFVLELFDYMSPVRNTTPGAILGEGADYMGPESVQPTFVNVLTRIKDEAFQENGVNITSAILSFPEYFNVTISKQLQAACADIGIDLLNLLPRSTAAAAGANALPTTRVLVIDYGRYHLRLRTFQEIGYDKNPIFPQYYAMDPLGSSLVEHALRQHVLSTNEILAKQIELGADRSFLQAELDKARMMIKDNIDVLMGKTQEDHHHDEWPLELNDWWISETHDAVLLWEDVKAVEERYVDVFSNALRTYLIALRMKREDIASEKSSQTTPENVDLVVIVGTNGDVFLMDRAVRQGLGDHIKIHGSVLRDAIFGASDGSARSALRVLERWKSSRSKAKQKAPYMEPFEHGEL